ncbi:MAG: DoxX family protein [Rhizobiaceae bacterium]|nr:DoxX family protein [Rhizobiaceae bacterium]
MNNATILLIARILLALIFILAGLNKFGNIAGTAGYIGSVGLPMGTLLAWGTAIFEVVAGIAILIGFQTKLTSYALAAFCIVSAAIFHNNFGDQIQFILFMKNLAMAGGFLALSVSGPGSISVDAKRG